MGGILTRPTRTRSGPKTFIVRCGAASTNAVVQNSPSHAGQFICCSEAACSLAISHAWNHYARRFQRSTS